MIRVIQQEGREGDLGHATPCTEILSKAARRQNANLCSCDGRTSANIQIHTNENTFLGGLHLEMTGEDARQNVSMADIAESDLLERYFLCDPRLSTKQAIELALLVKEKRAQFL